MAARDCSRDERGAAAVETALCLSVLVLPLLFAMIAYGYMFSFREALSQATTEGARAAVGAQPAAGQLAARQAVNRSLASYGVACDTGGNLRKTSSSAVVGSCSAAYDQLTCPVGTLLGGSTPVTRCHATVTVSYRYRDHSLLPTVPGLGFTLPETLSFTSVVEVG